MLDKHGKCNHKLGVTAMGYFTAGSPMQAKCGTCCLVGPKVYQPEDPIEAFWKMVEEQEKSMSTSDYKRGVEDATKPMTEDDPFYNDPKSGSLSYFDFTNTVLSERRKELLTKKVTKWFLVYNNDNTGSLRICGQFTNPWNNEGIGKATLYNSREEALAAYHTLTIVGAFPIEIEVEL